MDLTNYIILLGGAVVLLSVFASIVSARVGVPVLLIFLGLGMLLGEEGVGGIAFSNVQQAHLFGTLALAIILFDGGLRTETKSFRAGLKPALSLATIGVLVTAGVTGAIAAWLLGMSWLNGLLLGAIVGSTDAAAVFSLLHAAGLQLKQRVGATLEIESGTNDPMAIFLTIVLVEALQAGRGLGVDIFGQFVVQMALGGALGLGGGWLLTQLINRLQLTPGLYPLAALAGGLAVYGLTSILGGSGFLAIYLTGLVMGNRPLEASHDIRRFHDGVAWLSQIGMFLMLGLLVTPSALMLEAPKALLIAGVLIFLARPLAVFIALLPFHFPWREQIFIGWVGLRGAVPIILALFPLLAGLDYSGKIFNVAFFVVLVSLLLQGWTVASVARWLDLEVPVSSYVLQRVELDIPGQQELELVGYKLSTDSPILEAQREGLRVTPEVELAAVVRDGQLVREPSPRDLAGGDYVYLVANRQQLDGLDRLFAPGQASDRLQRFFGEFVLNGRAQMANVAAMYGLELPPEAQGRSVAEYIIQRLNTTPVVGDRVPLGDMELVVREVDQDGVTKVGLKLPH